MLESFNAPRGLVIYIITVEIWIWQWFHQCDGNILNKKRGQLPSISLGVCSKWSGWQRSASHQTERTRSSRPSGDLSYPDCLRGKARQKYSHIGPGIGLGQHPSSRCFPTLHPSC